MGGTFNCRFRNQDVVYVDHSQIVTSDSVESIRFQQDKHGNSAYNLLLLGDAQTGKTRLADRFCHGRYGEKSRSYTSTVTCNYASLTVELNGIRINVHVWDAAGKIHDEILPTLCRQAHAFVFVYDVTKEETFENLGYWLERVQSFRSIGVPFILVGNKNDLTGEKTVDYERAKEFADKKGSLSFEVSAKDGTNVELAFMSLISAVRELECGAVSPHKKE